MIAHYKTQVLNMHFINKVEVQGFVCEKKSRPMNYLGCVCKMDYLGLA
jgi:hypothetical protein